MRFLIINRRHNFARDQIGCAYLQGDDSLTASRYEIFLRQYFGKKLLALKFKLRRHESEPLQAGARQNNRVPIAFDKFAQTGWHISAQPYDLRAGVTPTRLPLSPHTSRRDCCDRYVRCSFPEQQIFHCATGQHCCDYKCALNFAGQILRAVHRSEEHTSELQSHSDLVCRLLLEKKNIYMKS